MVVQYIRDKKGDMKGCVVKTDEGKLGYFLCHKLDKKKTNKKLTRQIAIDRAEKIRIILRGDGSMVSERMNQPMPERHDIPHTVTTYLKPLM